MGFLFLSFASLSLVDLKIYNHLIFACLSMKPLFIGGRGWKEEILHARFPVSRLAHSSHAERCQDRFRKQGNVFFQRIIDIHMTIFEKYVFMLQKKEVLHACLRSQVGSAQFPGRTLL